LHVVSFLLAAAPNATAQEDKEKELPRITILATGGTIAAASGSRTGGSYVAARRPVDKLIEAVPELRELARVEGEQVAQIASQAMNDAVWLRLARRVNELLASSEVDGIVITHGTDTLEETAFFLHLVIESDKPVVLVGAQRAPDTLSADGPLNLYNAVAVAAAPRSRGQGVLVALDDVIHGARNVTKAHTTGTAAFRSPGSGPLGEVLYGEVRFSRRALERHTRKSALRLGDLEALPRVEIVYGHANHRRLFVDAAVEAGARGIVLAGVGNGNPSPETEKALVEARKEGVAVVRSSRVGGGRVTRNAEVDDDEHGFVAAGTLNPQKARVLLLLALTRTSDPAEIQRIFDDY
jgi:L-asparaginase